MKKNIYTKTLLLLAFLNLVHATFSQKTDSTKSITHLSGSISITNNGISVIPTFTLGKPAAIFTASVGKNRFSFDPELRFSLAGKPWGFIFWGRYKLVTAEKFHVSAGTHLGIAYKTTLLPAKQWFYRLSRNVSLQSPGTCLRLLIDTFPRK